MQSNNIFDTRENRSCEQSKSAQPAERRTDAASGEPTVVPSPIFESKSRQADMGPVPDPKSLWKEIDPDEMLPYQKNHTAVDRKVSDDFVIVAASRRGRSHAHCGAFRDDDFAIEAQGGWRALAVADGAGSAKFSREGSRLACQAASGFLVGKLNESLLNFEEIVETLHKGDKNDADRTARGALYSAFGGAAFEAYKCIEREAVEKRSLVKDYATTLLLAAVKMAPSGVFIATFGIGDGVIGSYCKLTGEAELMNAPDGGEFAGQTRFLTTPEIIGDGEELARRIRFNVFEPPVALFLMTDGVSDPKFNPDENLRFNGEWRKFYHELLAEGCLDPKDDAAAHKLLEWLNFWARGEHDDRTLAVLLTTERSDI